MEENKIEGTCPSCGRSPQEDLKAHQDYFVELHQWWEGLSWERFERYLIPPPKGSEWGEKYNTDYPKLFKDFEKSKKKKTG